MAWPGAVRGISTGLECRGCVIRGKMGRHCAIWPPCPATLQFTGIPFSPAHNSRSSSHHAMNQGNTRVPAGGGSGMGGKSACRKAQIATRKRKSRRDFARLRCALEVSRHLTETARDAKPEQMPVGSKRFLSAPQRGAPRFCGKLANEHRSFPEGARGPRAAATAGISIHAANANRDRLMDGCTSRISTHQAHFQRQQPHEAQGTDEAVWRAHAAPSPSPKTRTG